MYFEGQIHGKEVVGPGNDVPGKSPQRLSFQDSCDIGSGPVRYSRVEVRAVAWCRRVGDGHKVRIIVGRVADIPMVTLPLPLTLLCQSSIDIGLGRISFLSLYVCTTNG